MTICRQTVWRWLKHYSIHSSCSPLPRSSCPTKLTCEVLELIDSAMQGDDETTSQELVVKLQGLDFYMSKCTVLTGCTQLGGITMDPLIASLYVTSIGKNVWNGHWHTGMITFMMSFGLMKQPCSWKVIAVFVVARRDRNLSTNLDQSIPRKFTFGLESVGEGPLRFASLLV